MPDIIRNSLVWGHFYIFRGETCENFIKITHVIIFIESKTYTLIMLTELKKILEQHYLKNGQNYLKHIIKL